MTSKKISPESEIKRNIFPLNNALPDEVVSTWATAEELYNRLIHAGVRQSLTLQMVQDALRRNNTNGKHLKSWEYNKARYFRSASAHKNDEKTGPLEQRFKLKSTGRQIRVDINPPRNYFNSINNTSFTVINNALQKLEQKKEEEREQEIEREKEERKNEQIREEERERLREEVRESERGKNRRRIKCRGYVVLLSMQ